MAIRAMESVGSNSHRLTSLQSMVHTDTTRIRTLETIVLISIGGFAGSNLRYGVAQIVPDLVSTLVVNAAGSFLLGFIAYEALRTDVLTAETRILLSTGFLSSFTTYSTFALESIRSQPPLLVLNIIATYTLGFGGVLVGRWLAGTFEARGEG